LWRLYYCARRINRVGPARLCEADVAAITATEGFDVLLGYELWLSRRIILNLSGPFR